ncbi:hypothetical protein RUM43_012404 [Polyplax serrata]|uniref:Uncharacterized protein n=1 Tax=Polyplax serrata TaxID=468196 RepID=A0AAN8S0C0_POLSC
MSTFFRPIGKVGLWQKIARGSFFCVVSSIVGYGFLIYAVAERNSAENYLDSEIVLIDERPWNIILLAEIVVGGLIVLFAILVYISAWGKLADNPSSCLRSCGSKSSYLTSLIGGLVLVGVWFLEMSYIHRNFGYLTSDQANCEDYKTKDDDKACISISFLTDERVRTLCGTDLIKKFCDIYMEAMEFSYALYLFADYVMIVTLTGKDENIKSPIVIQRKVQCGDQVPRHQVKLLSVPSFDDKKFFGSLWLGSKVLWLAAPLCVKKTKPIKA